jgi:2-haloacid dehalogenase
VLTLTLERLAAKENFALPEGEAAALARSLPEWEPFPEVPAALEEARGRGWRLAILSNTDRDFIAASKARLGVPFDETIVASEIGSYKPGHRHWSEFFARTHADRARHVHVAASLFHDIAPANELGLRSVWVNRLGEIAEPQPTREIADLSGLADVLDELVPA